ALIRCCRFAFCLLVCLLPFAFCPTTRYAAAVRRTRILVTMGPASNSPATIRALIDAGADAFRLNFSHGVAADHAETCQRIRAAAVAAEREVAVLQDLGGPKIRTRPLASPVTPRDGGP